MDGYGGRKMTFTEKAMEVSKRYWQGSFEHPFVTGLQDGTLGDSIFRYYLLQDRYYLEHFSKLYQIISDASDDAEVKELMRRNSQHLAEGEQLIREEFFQELGIDEEEIKNTPIAPTAYNYVSHLYRQLAEKNVVVACAGMLPCPWLYQAIGEQLIKQGSPHEMYQRWIMTYAGEDSKEAVQYECGVIERLYEEATDETKEEMIEAFYRSCQFEYLFWEMAYIHETWKLEG